MHVMLTGAVTIAATAIIALVSVRHLGDQLARIVTAGIQRARATGREEGRVEGLAEGYAMGVSRRLDA